MFYQVKFKNEPNKRFMTSLKFVDSNNIEYCEKYLNEIDFINAKIKTDEIKYFCEEKIGHFMKYSFISENGNCIIRSSVKTANIKNVLPNLIKCEPKLIADITAEEKQQIGNSNYYIITKRKEYSAAECESIANAFKPKNWR